MELISSNNSGKKFVTILADGKFHQSVPEGTPGEVQRQYEDKEGFMKTKNELVFDSVTGKITKISFEDGDFGKSLQLEIDGEGVVSVGTASNFGEDLMKKLPNIDLAQPVKLVPYAITDGGKNKRGVTVYQNDAKVNSFYWNGKETINGLPETGDTSKFTSDDWKVYFITARKFLVSEVEKLIANMNEF